MPWLRRRYLHNICTSAWHQGVFEHLSTGRFTPNNTLVCFEQMTPHLASFPEQQWLLAPMDVITLWQTHLRPLKNPDLGSRHSWLPPPKRHSKSPGVRCRSVLLCQHLALQVTTVVHL
jgi:hypothetical protein